MDIEIKCLRLTISTQKFQSLIFLHKVIAETNEGYKNSLVPIRVRLLCIQESSIPDGQDSTNTLNQFTRSQVGFENTKNLIADYLFTCEWTMNVHSFIKSWVLVCNNFHLIPLGYFQ